MAKKSADAPAETAPAIEPTWTNALALSSELGKMLKAIGADGTKTGRVFAESARNANRNCMKQIQEAVQSAKNETEHNAAVAEGRMTGAKTRKTAAEARLVAAHKEVQAADAEAKALEG